MRLILALVMLASIISSALPSQAQEGVGSWYGNPYHGRKAANGSRYNMYQMTAAHPKLPFGTKVVVENITTHQSVILTITDRGPFAKGRVIDVSKVAAIKLGMIKSGTAPVKITVLGKKPIAEPRINIDELASAAQHFQTIEAAKETLTPTKVNATPSVLMEPAAEVPTQEVLTAVQEKEQLLKQMDVIVSRLKELESK
jgi:rare lipoprotein A